MTSPLTSLGFSAASLLTRAELLDHARHPRNRGELSGADIVQEEVNPLCGDAVTVYATLGRRQGGLPESPRVPPMAGRVGGRPTAEQRIIQMSFTGSGCIISQAASSLLTEHARGKTADDILRMERADVERLLGGSVSPSRLTCAMLALVALKNGLHAFGA